MDEEYIQGWKRFEELAGRHFSHEQREKMRKGGIIFDRVVGRPPDRRRVVYTYWSLYLRFMVKSGGKFLVFVTFLITYLRIPF